MSRVSRWRQTANKVITAALGDGQAKGLEGRELERFVSNHYPFGPREMYPYKIWLNEFALLVRGEAKPMSRPRKPDRAPSGQLDLFPENSP